MGIIAWVVFGFVIGLLARALVPGRQKMGFFLTTVLGIAGSLAGGLVATAIHGGNDYARFQGAGFIGSLIGAIALLLVASAVTGPRRRAA